MSTYTIKAADIMQTKILSCPPDTSISKAAELIYIYKTSSIVIKQGSDVIGILTEADCARINFASPEIFAHPVSEFMSSPVISIEHDTQYKDIIRAFNLHKIRHLIVKKHGDVVGILSQTDVVRRQGIEHFLQHRVVKDNYNSRVPIFDAQGCLEDILVAMAHQKHSSVIVKNEETSEYGIITERDLLKILAKGEKAEKPLWAYAAHPLITTTPDESLLQSFLTLQRYRIRHLGVVNENNEVIGVLAMQNVISGVEHSYFQELEKLITQRDNALNMSQKHLFLAEKVIEYSLDAIMISDKHANIISVNPAFSSITGYKAREVIGKNANILNSGYHGKQFYCDMWESIEQTGKWQGEIWNRRKSGEVFPEWLTIVKIGNQIDGDIHYAGIFSDITERKSDEAKIRSLAFYDELTNLPNRRLFQDRLDIAISTAHRNKQLAAILFIDLDRFKQINDTLGHKVGDELLIAAANRISSSIKEGDTVSRFGGDEFVILLTEMNSVEDIRSVINRIHTNFNEPFMLNGKENYVTTSIGAAVYPLNGIAPEDLLKHADIAMYQAKQQGRNGYAFYQKTMNEQHIAKLQLQNKLRAALKAQEFELHYQVQVNSASHQIVGIEALLRWNQPELGQISPGIFIPLAEELGIISDIEKWVLTEACQQRKHWLSLGVDVGRVAVNISALHFNNDVVNSIIQTIESTGLPAQYLEIEVTESCFIENVIEADNKLNKIKSLGVKVALDDFGTGYSSLSYLTKLSIDTLKIDASFIQKAPQNEKDCQLIKTIINMAKGLSLNVLAEGVETDAQKCFLSQNECLHHQGYFYGKPLNAQQLEAFLLRYSETERLIEIDQSL
ncbi:EAL domain-containing protein [Thalassotalea ganghwensis]